MRVISVSGGKDSTALYLWAKEEFGTFMAVFADTGHEHPVTVNYVKNLHEMAGGGPIVQIVKADFTERLAKKGLKPSDSAFLDLILWKGRTPSSKAQFCTEHVKLKPIKDWVEAVRGDDDVVMYTGIRAGESLRRSKMAEVEWSDFYDCEMRRPLLKWSEEDVFAMLKKHGVPPNPLYTEVGMSRVGCFPCIHARKSDLARLPDWAWEKLERWEKALGRSWFPAGLVPGKFIPTVADAREWSKTLWGGRKVDPDAPEGRDVPSCMSTWGTCE